MQIGSKVTARSQRPARRFKQLSKVYRHRFRSNCRKGKDTKNLAKGSGKTSYGWHFIRFLICIRASYFEMLAAGLAGLNLAQLAGIAEAMMLVPAPTRISQWPMTRMLFGDYLVFSFCHQRGQLMRARGREGSTSCSNSSPKQLPRPPQQLPQLTLTLPSLTPSQSSISSGTAPRTIKAETGLLPPGG